MKIFYRIGIFIVVVFIFFVINIYIQNQNPQIELGVYEGRFHELSNKPNSVSTQTADISKLVKPLDFKGSLEESKSSIIKAFEEYSSIEIKKETRNYIHAISTTPILKFRDDIEVYFDENNSLVHYRSASRAGYSDMGLNRERYNKIAEFYRNN